MTGSLELNKDELEICRAAMLALRVIMPAYAEGGHAKASQALLDRIETVLPPVPSGSPLLAVIDP